MTLNGKRVVCLAGATLLCIAARAVTPDPAPAAIANENPYSGIVERNVFALKAPVPPVVETKVDPGPPPPKIILSGITTILGHPIALMKVTLPPKPPEPGKPPPAATETSMMLSDGQRDGQIEVLQIDTAAKTVKVNNYGTEQLLSFDSNGAKSIAPVAAPAGIPGGIPSPAGFKSPGGFPIRTLRVPTPGAPNSNPFANPVSNPSGNTGVAQGTTPGGIGGINPSGNSSQFEVAAPEMKYTPEEQVILMEAERHRNRNNPNAAPLPPTEMTSPEDAAAVMAPGSPIPGVKPPGRR